MDTACIAINFELNPIRFFAKSRWKVFQSFRWVSWSALNYRSHFLPIPPPFLCDQTYFSSFLFQFFLKFRGFRQFQMRWKACFCFFPHFPLSHSSPSSHQQEKFCHLDFQSPLQFPISQLHTKIDFNFSPPLPNAKQSW